MTANVGTINPARTVSLGHVPAWAWMGIWVYTIVLINGSLLLGDSDTYWQIATGKWILDHGAMPRFDIYSFTKPGEPWISTSWLAQVLFAISYQIAGWAGPIILAAMSFAATLALFTSILSRRIRPAYAVMVAFAVLFLSMGHVLARPHVLAAPVMLAWVSGLASASDRREAPSFWLLPLITLWANLHGGFVLGIALIAPFALDALLNANRSQWVPLVLRWMAFGTAALVAACITPYGWESILASRKILELGELLKTIFEWMPVNFSAFSAFEGWILLSIAGALYCGVRLSPPRIILVLGLLHMALCHVRNIEVFTLLMPLVVLTPLATQFALQPPRGSRTSLSFASAAVLIAVLGASTWAVAAHNNYAPTPTQSPAAAVDVLKQRNARRILNDLPFSGYLIARGVPVFVDGRAELYGEAFVMKYFHALQLKDVNLLLGLLKDYDIDAVMLTPTTPAVTFLDHLDGWQRVYADEYAVVHVRKTN